MYTPHSVTIYNACRDGSVCMAFLDGVLLSTSYGSSMMKKIAACDDGAVLFIPFACRAVDPVSGQEQRFCTPREFDRLENHEGVWTVGTRDARSCADCFFVKGKVVEPDMSFAEINDQFEDVFRVSSVDVRDFGSTGLRHWKIGGK